MDEKYNTLLVTYSPILQEWAKGVLDIIDRMDRRKFHPFASKNPHAHHWKNRRGKR